MCRRTAQAAVEYILPQLLTSMMHRGLVLDELGPDARHAWEPGSHAMWMGLARTPGSQVVRRLDIKASVEPLGWDRGGQLSEHKWWGVAAAAILTVMFHSMCGTSCPRISAAFADLPALRHALRRQLLCLGAGRCMWAGQAWAVSRGRLLSGSASGNCMQPACFQLCSWLARVDQRGTSTHPLTHALPQYFNRALRHWANHAAGIARRYNPAANGLKLSDQDLQPITREESRRGALWLPAAIAACRWWTATAEDPAPHWILLTLPLTGFY